MRDEPKPANIFDVASKSAKVKPKLKPVEQPAAQPTEPLVALTREEVDIMFKRMHEIKDAINEKLEALYKKSGVSHKRMLEVVEKMRKHEREEVMKLQKEHNALEERVWKVLGASAKQMKEQKDAAKSSKNRKAKTIGARRGWIQTK